MSSTGKKTIRVSQETFDGVVRENMEDFGMDLQEALQDAIHTFQLQGADIRGLIIDGSKAEKYIDPLLDAIKEVERASNDNGGKLEHILKSLDELYSMCNEGGIATVSVAGRHGGVEACLLAFNAIDSSEFGVNSILKILNLLTEDAESRDKFRQSGGPRMLMSILKSANASPGNIMYACSLISSAASEDEVAMEQFMENDADQVLPSLLKQSANDEGLVLCICGAFKALVTADDNRVVASKAFQNARAFAEHGMVEALLLASTKLQQSLSAVACICMTLKILAVNEAICKSIADQQGIDFSLQILVESITKVEGNALAKNACSLLSQLAGSDENKKSIINKGGLERLISTMSIFSNDPSMLQEAFAVITVLSLRSPQNALKAVEAGVLDIVKDAMECHAAAATMQRQACLLLRNLAVRSAQSRSAILEKGLELLIRDAKSKHAVCKDAASAALRDLGIDDYNC